MEAGLEAKEKQKWKAKKNRQRLETEVGERDRGKDGPTGRWRSRRWEGRMQYLKEEEGMKLRKKSWIYIGGNVVVEWVSS